MRMSLITAIVVAMALVSGCGKRSQLNLVGKPMQALQTGHKNPENIAYTAGGDRRIEEARTRAIKDLKNPSPAELKTQQLAQSIEKIKLYRYNFKDKLARFGRKSFHFEVKLNQETLTFTGFFRGENTKIFIDPIKAKDNSSFSLKGVIVRSPKSEEGTFFLYHSGKSSMSETKVEILYRSYLGRVKVHTRRSLDDQELEESLEPLKQTQRAWTRNWAVPFGPSFYEIDLLAQAKAKKEIGVEDDTPSLIELSGSALQTNTTSPDATVTDNTIAGLEVTGASLYGDSGGEDLRTLKLSVESNGHQTDVLVESIGIENNNAKGETERHDDGPNIDQAEEPESIEQPSDSSGSTPELIGLNREAFLKTSYGENRLIDLMIHDFENNHNLPVVQSWIHKVATNKNSVGIPPDKRDKRFDYNLLNFMKIASPFRKVLKPFYEIYQVPFSAFYLTVNESTFFRTKTYPIELGDRTSTGPMQINHKTAIELEMNYDTNQQYDQLPALHDERRYVVSSVCAAAKYLHILRNKFIDSDTTLAILAYNMGHRGLTNKVKENCDKLSDLSDKKTCTVLSDANDFPLTFATIARQEMVPDERIEYVSRFLAYYFVGGSPSRYGFEPPTNVATTFPKELLLPPNPIKDKTCRELAQKIL